MAFTIRRLNLKHNVNFSLRSNQALSRSIISTYKEKAPQQVFRFVRQPMGLFEILVQLLTRSLIVSLVVLTPVAQAHAKAKKRKIVAVTFDSPSFQDPNAVKAPVTQDSKISRTLRPVDRYSDDSTDQAIAEDTGDDSSSDVEPLRTVASVKVVKMGPVSAEAAVSDSFLDNTPLEQNVDIPTGSAEYDNGQEFLEESTLSFVEED